MCYRIGDGTMAAAEAEVVGVAVRSVVAKAVVVVMVAVEVGVVEEAAPGSSQVQHQSL